MILLECTHVWTTEAIFEMHAQSSVLSNGVLQLNVMRYEPIPKPVGPSKCIRDD